MPDSSDLPEASTIVDLAPLVAAARDGGAEAFMARAWAWLGRHLRFDGGSVITSFARRQSYVDIHTHGIADLRALMASYEPVRHLDGMGARLLAQAGRAMVFAAEDPDNLDEAHRPLREHLVRFGLEFGLGVAVPRAGEEAVTVLLLYRARPAPPFAEAERARLDALGPVLAELMAVNRALALVRDPRTGLGELAVALVDADGRFVQSTPAFVRGFWGEVPPRDPHLPGEVLEALRGGQVHPLPGGKLVLQPHADAGHGLLLRLRAANRADVLSPREREVAALYAAGESHRQIARRLGLAPSTVRNHVSHCYEKLAVRSRVALLKALGGDS
jgi:DNA-binding CsgD family transcriptional regulator